MASPRSAALLVALALGASAEATASPAAGLCIFDYDNTMTRGMGWWNLDPSSPLYMMKGPDEEQCGAKLPMDIWWQQAIRVGEAKKQIRMFAGVYAAQAIHACLLNNFRIGIATSSDCPSVPNVDPEMVSRLSLLEHLGIPGIVSHDGGQRGPAYACLNASVHNKGQMIKRISEYYHIPLSKTVFFDDYQGFLDIARKGAPGVHTVLASSGDGCNGQNIFCPTACGLSEAETESGLREVLGYAPKMPEQSALTTFSSESMSLASTFASGNRGREFWASTFVFAGVFSVAALLSVSRAARARAQAAAGVGHEPLLRGAEA